MANLTFSSEHILPAETHSVRNKVWKDRCEDEAAITQLEQDGGISPLLARLLAGRGIGADDISDFLNPKLKTQLPDPLSLQDMDKAVELILEAVVAKKSIVVFADYDVDGATSAAQLIRWARAIGTELGLYVPDRVAEGYGPSIEAFKTLKAKGADLVITVDCGAAATDALKAAVDIDLPIIVVDHHLMETQMPPAAAIINPNRHDDSSGLGHLAAAGVVFMLLVALTREAKRRRLKNIPNILDYIGLTALGTICDVVNLSGLNRVFVTQGLKVLSRRDIPGIRALTDIAGTTGALTSYHAGFVLGPRLNAGGRIGRADMGAELLSTDNSQLAYAHAAELDRVNTERKTLQSHMLEEALSQANACKDDAVIIVDMEGWHPGIIGIVAGRLKDHFDKPAIVIGINPAGDGKGSGRSIKGVNLGEAIVKAKQAGLLSSGGGHEMAGGLSVRAEDIPALKVFLNTALVDDVDVARQNLGLYIDSWITIPSVHNDLMNVIELVGPYGAGNPQPVFAFENMRIAYAQRLGGGHVRCAFEDVSGARLLGICFRADEMGLSDILLSPTAPRVHIAGRLKRDTWKGRSKIDFQLMDICEV